jgi:hypothetical protein
MNDIDITEIFDKTLSQFIRGHAESSCVDEYHNLTRLWCEVVRLAIQDIHYGRNNAIEWLHSRDFVTVCQLANLPNPERLRRAILKLPRGRRLNSLAA